MKYCFNFFLRQLANRNGKTHLFWFILFEKDTKTSNKADDGLIRLKKIFFYRTKNYTALHLVNRFDLFIDRMQKKHEKTTHKQTLWRAHT